MFIGEVFPIAIEVSDGLLHSLGSCQKVNLYLARVFAGAHEEFVFIIRTDHSNACTKSHVHW